MWRVLVSVMGFAVVATAALTVAFSPPPERPIPNYVVHSATAANATASALFADLVLPNGSHRLANQNISTWQNIDPFSLSYPAPQSAGGFWQVPMSFGRLTAFISHHVPIGLHVESSLEPGGSLTSGSLIYWNKAAWVSGLGESSDASPFTRVFYALSSPSPSATSTVVHIGIQVYWAPLRPADEEVPSGTSYVTVTRIGSHAAQPQRVTSIKSSSSSKHSAITRFARVIRALPVQLHGVSLECFGPSIGPTTTLYHYMISFASSPSAQPDLVVNVRFCSNIDVTVRGKHEPALLPGTNTWGDLYHAIEAVFSPGVPPVFFSG